jgi:hypothetical protein
MWFTKENKKKFIIWCWVFIGILLLILYSKTHKLLIWCYGLIKEPTQIYSAKYSICSITNLMCHFTIFNPWHVADDWIHRQNKSLSNLEHLFLLIFQFISHFSRIFKIILIFSKFRNGMYAETYQNDRQNILNEEQLSL